MSGTLNTVLDYLMKVGVDYNLHQNNYWGVLFYKKNNVTCALVASPYYSIEIEGIDIEPEKEFYSYYENAWISNPYPLPAEQILRQITENKNYIGKMIIPFPNLVNHINKVSDADKKKSRLIFSPNPLEQGDLLLKFQNVNGTLQYVHPKIPKAFKIAEHSFIPASFVKPDTFYRCRVVSESQDSMLVTCLETYGKVRMGIHYSGSGFIPDDMEEINKLKKIPQDKIMCVNVVEPNNLLIPPIHVDCIMFYDVVKALGVVDALFVEIHIGDNPNHPILIRNVRNDGQMQVNIVYATLNWVDFGPQRR